MSNIYKSILRYPGGKQKLITKILDKYLPRDKTFKLAVEPFAGSSAFSIAMLESGRAERVALNDKDELVASLWQIIFSPKADKLAKIINEVDVSVKTWSELKEYQPKSTMAKAFKCLYLNRTSFSGILRDEIGPIGGKNQKSKYTIDCRFNREFLADRIIELSKLRDRVVMKCSKTYDEMYFNVKQYAEDESIASNDILWYFDPPYYYKADKLYRHFFDDEEHRKLYQLLSNSNFNGDWILSYDYSSFIVNLYSKLFDLNYIEQNYTCAAQRGNKVNELIITNIHNSSTQTKKDSLVDQELLHNEFDIKVG